MLRRMLGSMFLGAVIAFAVSFAPAVTAACQGYCADLFPGGGVFAGCDLTLDANGNVIGVRCRYTFPAPPNPEPGPFPIPDEPIVPVVDQP